MQACTILFDLPSGVYAPTTTSSVQLHFSFYNQPISLLSSTGTSWFSFSLSASHAHLLEPFSSSRSQCIQFMLISPFQHAWTCSDRITFDLVIRNKRLKEILVPSHVDIFFLYTVIPNLCSERQRDLHQPGGHEIRPRRQKMDDVWRVSLPSRKRSRWLRYWAEDTAAMKRVISPGVDSLSCRELHQTI